MITKRERSGKDRLCIKFQRKDVIMQNKKNMILCSQPVDFPLTKEIHVEWLEFSPTTSEI